MNRQRQAEPGSRVRLGGESRAVGRYRGARVPLDKKDIGRAELRNVRRAQLPEPLWLLEAHVQESAPRDGVNLPDVVLDPALWEDLPAEGLAPLVGGRQACDPGGVHRRMPELPGE